MSLRSLNHKDVRNCVFIEKCEFLSRLLVNLNYAGINLTGYHPPGPLIFSVKIPVPGTAFQCKTPAPGSENEAKIPTPRHNLPSSNAKRSIKKEHNFIKSVSFQIFHNCPFDNFLFLVRIKYSQVFIQHLRLILFEA